MESQPLQPIHGKIITDHARDWLDGRIEDNQYFEMCYNLAYEGARAQVEARLAQKRLAREQHTVLLETQIDSVIWR